MTGINRRSFLSKLLTLPVAGMIAAKMVPVEAPLTATAAMIAEAKCRIKTLRERQEGLKYSVNQSASVFQGISRDAVDE